MLISRTCLWAAIERVLITVWVGALWTVGFVVAPVLFSELDRSTAGTLAGILFHYLNFAGLVIGSGLLLRNRLTTQATLPALLLALMLLLILINEFAIAPEIATLRETGLAAGSEAAKRFGLLHGVASLLYLINALFGLVLAVVGARGVSRQDQTRC